MNKGLTKWCDENGLELEILEFECFRIKGCTDTFCFLVGVEKVIDKDLNYIWDVFEYEYHKDNAQATKIVFQFGGCYYFEKFAEVVRVNFVEFKHIGLCKNSAFDYFNLGIHSEYEILNGVNKISDYVRKAQFLGHKGLGLCDYNTLAGVVVFQEQCVKAGLKAVIGETILVNIENGNSYELKLYVINEVGWHNLLRINTFINVRNEDKYVFEKQLLECGEGLVCVVGRVSYLADRLELKVWNDFFNRISKVFKNVYFQVDSVEFSDDRVDMKHLHYLKFYLDNFFYKSERLVNPVILEDNYYVDKGYSHIKTLINKVDKCTYNLSNCQFYKSGGEVLLNLEPLFKVRERGGVDFILESFRNSLDIFDLCNFNIELGLHKLPIYEFVADSDAFFIEKVMDNFNKKGFEGDKIYEDRLLRECEVILGAGLSDYFLIIWDIVDWAKRQGILVGVGRGSVGGSLVAYLLGLTGIDPVKFNLLFERFLNEARVGGVNSKKANSLPDIDIDFESSRRNEVKDYIYQRFGGDNVCSLGSFDTFRLKSVLKDLGKVLGFEFSYINYLTGLISKKLEYEWGDVFADALQREELYEFVQKNHNFINDIKQVLNNPCNVSMHPSAVLITPKKDKNGDVMTIFDWLPMRKVDGVLVSEWDGDSVAKVGFLKEDILGISQLDKFRDILALIDEKVNLDDFPLDDEKVYKMFCKGFTKDVFQFGTDSLTKYIQTVQPTCFEDLVAVNALYCPGPLEVKAHEDFALIKNNKKAVAYDYNLYDVTKDTFGLYIFQEQIMQAVHKLGGLSLIEADEFRVAMKKYDSKIMRMWEDRFISGALERGCSEDEANIIFNKLVAFSKYGFNKSHSVAYTLMAYRCQYLKVHYSLFFYLVSLNYAKDSEEKFDIIAEIKSSKVRVTLRGVDINYSTKEFNCAGNKIFFGLNAVNKVGAKALQSIIDCRRDGFLSFEDFLGRIDRRIVNVGILENLVLAGAFDGLVGIEKDVCLRLEILRYIFEDCKALDRLEKYLELKNEVDWVLLQREVSGFGFIDFEVLCKKQRVKDRIVGVGELRKFSKLEYYNYCVCGRITKVKEVNNDKVGNFCVITLENNYEYCDVVGWNNFWSEYKDFLKEGLLVAINGYIKFDNYNQKYVLYSSKKSKVVFL